MRALSAPLLVMLLLAAVPPAAAGVEDDVNAVTCQPGRRVCVYEIAYGPTGCGPAGDPAVSYTFLYASIAYVGGAAVFGMDRCAEYDDGEARDQYVGAAASHASLSYVGGGVIWWSGAGAGHSWSGVQAAAIANPTLVGGAPYAAAGASWQGARDAGGAESCWITVWSYRHDGGDVVVVPCAARPPAQPDVAWGELLP